MKFTAVYNTESMKCIEYSFEAKSNEDAVRYCKSKFSVKDIFLISHDDDIKDWPIHIGDARKTSAIARAYHRKQYKEQMEKFVYIKK